MDINLQTSPHIIIIQLTELLLNFSQILIYFLLKKQCDLIYEIPKPSSHTKIWVLFLKVDKTDLAVCLHCREMTKGSKSNFYQNLIKCIFESGK